LLVSAERISPLFGSSFGTLLRRYREAAGITQEALAERAGLSVRGISDLERGVRQSPRRETVDLLAVALALPPHKRALLEAAARPMTSAEPPDALSVPPHNLPAALSPLVGRERETHTAMELLGRPQLRMLTLSGPGGVGKTRLALQVAQDVLPRFEDGVFLITLAATREPALMMQRIAEALSLRSAPGQPLAEQVQAFLHGRQALLVLDNFEHLLAAAPHVATLLAACPRVKALVTSREPLKIDGEHELLVAPLADDAAIELFWQRAYAAQPTLELTEADRDAVAAICRRVDRLPLAIELAAVWVRVLPPNALLAQLESPLELLTGGRRDAPARQRTLRDTIAWSEQLLEADERRLFHRLAIFVGSCSLEAAQAVCGEPALLGTARRDRSAVPGRQLDAPIDDIDVLDGLARLAEKSLLNVQMLSDGPRPSSAPLGTARGDRSAVRLGGSAVRFAMLETIREYALECLQASGDREDVGRRHADYYARLAADLGWIGPQQDTRDRQLERELPNVRAALEWARQHREPLIGLQLATPLGRWWYSRGHFDESERWLRDFLAIDTSAGERAVPAMLRVSAVYALILLALDRRNYDEAEVLAREGLELARRNGDVGGAGNMLAELGHVAEARGDLDTAMAFFEEGLAEYQKGKQGHPGAVGRTLSSLGNLARVKGDYAKAQRYLEQALAWAHEREFSFAIASGLVSLGYVAIEQDDYPRARTLYREALELYRTLRNPASLAWCLEGVAVVAADGDHERAARLCGSVASLRASAGAAPTPVVWPPFAQACAAARQVLGEERFTAMSAEGAALPAEQAVDYALNALGNGEAPAR
jgi:predicted ATPase/transcriptional regulator with XRE-family HTH domain